MPRWIFLSPGCFCAMLGRQFRDGAGGQLSFKLALEEKEPF